MPGFQWSDWENDEVGSLDITSQHLVLPEDPLTYAILSIPIPVDTTDLLSESQRAVAVTTESIRQQVESGRPHGRHRKET